MKVEDVQPRQIVQVNDLSSTPLLAGPEDIAARRAGVCGKVTVVTTGGGSVVVWVRHGGKDVPYFPYELTLLGVPCDSDDPEAEENRLAIGTSVLTCAISNPDTDWEAEAMRTRCFGIRGVVTSVHDSHGLCYGVRHNDGVVSYYSPKELKVWNLHRP